MTGIKEQDFEEAMEGLDAICDDYEKVLSLNESGEGGLDIE